MSLTDKLAAARDLVMCCATPTYGQRLDIAEALDAAIERLSPPTAPEPDHQTPGHAEFAAEVARLREKAANDAYTEAMRVRDQALDDADRMRQEIRRVIDERDEARQGLDLARNGLHQAGIDAAHLRAELSKRTAERDQLEQDLANTRAERDKAVQCRDRVKAQNGRLHDRLERIAQILDAPPSSERAELADQLEPDDTDMTAAEFRDAFNRAQPGPRRGPTPVGPPPTARIPQHRRRTPAAAVEGTWPVHDAEDQDAEPQGGHPFWSVSCRSCGHNGAGHPIGPDLAPTGGPCLTCWGCSGYEPVRDEPVTVPDPVELYRMARSAFRTPHVPGYDNEEG